MTDPDTIIYPTIDLFSYDLAEGLGQSEDESNQNRNKFWRRINVGQMTADQLADVIKIESELSDYIELLGKDCKEFDYPLNGFYYPVKLNDTYALQVHCAIDLTHKDRDDPSLKYAPRHIPSFQKIQENIVNNLHGSQTNQPDNHIGQTWFVWGQLAFADQKASDAAKRIYGHLKIFDNSSWEKDLKTEINPSAPKLLGAECFELWQLPSDRGDLSQNKHLLICIFPHELNILDISQTLSKLYPSLMRLFLYRHKIIWSYHLSRQHKSELKNQVQKIQTAIALLANQDHSSQIDLAQLQQSLKSNLNLMNTYVQELIYLESQKNTIATNLENYQNKLRRLENHEEDIDIPFLEKFATIVTKKYIPQIIADITNLSPNQKFLENSIRNIEGIISLEQTRSERSLNQSIFAVGTGLGTSQITVNILTAQFPVNAIATKSNTLFLIYMVAAFLGSIVIGGLSGGGVWWWLHRRSRNSKNP
ncbi:hypothetical protein [Pseudanabaena sp. UWO310]|uniref:hypothetical protein n=1 Tax=Pseudanabaena sp. UWO310 TaxID=2480795 RepID=UPI001159D7B9|nr:hypothetical protein [Pseudanabaena sp. UWO310]TYQ28199.1 hypothetical protein PseudUWO310_14340 [Pseudanabaena sp. UWO310]